MLYETSIRQNLLRAQSKRLKNVHESRLFSFNLIFLQQLIKNPSKTSSNLPAVLILHVRPESLAQHNAKNLENNFNYSTAALKTFRRSSKSRSRLSIQFTSRLSGALLLNQINKESDRPHFSSRNVSCLGEAFHHWRTHCAVGGGIVLASYRNFMSNPRPL